MQISIGYVRINISYLFHRFYDYPEYCFSSNSFCSVIRHYTSLNIIKMYKLLVLALSLIIVSCATKVNDSIEFEATYKGGIVANKEIRRSIQGVPYYLMYIYVPEIREHRNMLYTEYRKVFVEVPSVVYLKMYNIGDTVR